MDLYVVLGLTHGATEPEIKRAYRRLARRFHPDINPGDRAAELRFRQILDAYETLIDPERRVRYDAGGSVTEAERRASGFEGFDFSHYQPGDVLCMSRADVARRGLTDVLLILTALAKAAGRAGLLIEPQINNEEMRVIFK